MIVELIKLANDLDNRGLVKEADVIDKVILKFAGGTPLDADENPSWQLVGAEGEAEETDPVGEGTSLYDATLGKAFMDAFHLLTPHQLDVLGDLLMEGGPADATGSDLERAKAGKVGEWPAVKTEEEATAAAGKWESQAHQTWAESLDPSHPGYDERELHNNQLTPAQRNRRSGGQWNRADDGVV